MWKPVRFHELPGWLQNQWNPGNFKINKKLVKVFHGDGYSYKIRYTRGKNGRIYTNCWVRYRGYSPPPTFSKNVTALVGIILFCIFCFILVSQPGIIEGILPQISTVSPDLPANSPVVTTRPTQGYTGIYKVGSIATDNSGKEGIAIVSNNFEGQYFAQKVYLEASGKGWYSKEHVTPQWISYYEVESRYPTRWGGGIMDTQHIPDRDWTITSTSQSVETVKVSPELTDFAQNTAPPVPYSQDNIQVNVYDVERQVFALTNNERIKFGLSPLIWDEKLAGIAREHSQDMAINGYIGHINQRGEDPTARAIKNGYNVRKALGGGVYMDGIGENIAGMYVGRIVLTCPNDEREVQNTASGIAEAMMDAWMNHDSCQANGHRDNILNTDNSNLGVGVAYDGSMYVATQDFW